MWFRDCRTARSSSTGSTCSGSASRPRCERAVRRSAHGCRNAGAGPRARHVRTPHSDASDSIAATIASTPSARRLTGWSIAQTLSGYQRSPNASRSLRLHASANRWPRSRTAASSARRRTTDACSVVRSGDRTYPELPAGSGGPIPRLRGLGGAQSSSEVGRLELGAVQRGHKLAAARDADLREDRLHVIADGMRGQVQPPRDLSGPCPRAINLVISRSRSVRA